MSAAISWKNYVTTESLEYLVSTATEDSSKPASNVANTSPQKKFRATYAISSGQNPLLRINFGAALSSVRVVAALNCTFSPFNASNISDVNLRLSDASISPLYTKTVTTANLFPRGDTTDRFNLFWILPAETSSAQYLFFYLTGGASGATGAFEIGHLWVGPALVWSGASAGVDRDWRKGTVDPSPVIRPRGGSFAAREYPRRRTLDVQKSLLTYAQAHGDSSSPSALSLDQFSEEAGVSRPVIVIPRDTSEHTLQKQSIYGLVRGEPPSIGHQGGDYYSTALSVEEIR